MASEEKRNPSTTTTADARALWADTVSPDASPTESIKADGVQAAPVSLASLLLPTRDLSEGAAAESHDVADFELREPLGKGGMGVVFSARQSALDRAVAVKMIDPSRGNDPEAKQKLLAEALVTGELDHPNIVPIYDLGVSADGRLFYAMKEVKGTSWDKVMRERTEAENLEILLEVCNAVAFAHDKGVVHRDLKPENVMIGDYGEVMVMDWGIAVSAARGNSKAQPLTEASGRAGTPAYMAPEMARCEFDKIGPASDIYLLGAILYEIVAGRPPHSGDNVYASIYAAMGNVVDPTDKRGELVDIALKAMATEPQDRYASVKDFQQAIRSYQSHAESGRLYAAAQERRERLGTAATGEVYRECTEIIAACQQALELWADNRPAVRCLRDTREAFVAIALERGDLALAESHVTAMQAECAKYQLEDGRLAHPTQLAARVAAAIAQAERRDRIARIRRWVTLVEALVVALVTAAAYFYTMYERDRALNTERLAKAERDMALADAAKQRRRAQWEHYVSTIATAERRIGGGLPAQAEAMLWAAPVWLRGWEWGALMTRCRPELARRYPVQPRPCRTRTAPGAIAASPDGARVVTVDAAPEVAAILDASSRKVVAKLVGHAKAVTAAAFSPDGKRVATGSRDGTVRVWDADTGRELLVLRATGGAVASVVFSEDGRRLTAAYADGTRKVWDALPWGLERDLFGGRRLP